jgi:predicted hydrolase (HD superfamily)
MAGLLHDFDYERYPDINQHAVVGGRILTERGFPAEVVHAVMSHNEATGVRRESLLDKVLFAVDELSGLVTATALVRPSKSIFEVDAAAVRRKLKDKAFARTVSRDDVQKGIEELGVAFDEHTAMIIAAMQAVAPAIGLQGVAESPSL